MKDRIEITIPNCKGRLVIAGASTLNEQFLIRLLVYAKYNHEPEFFEFHPQLIALDTFNGRLLYLETADTFSPDTSTQDGYVPFNRYSLYGEYGFDRSIGESYDSIGRREQVTMRLVLDHFVSYKGEFVPIEAIEMVAWVH